MGGARTRRSNAAGNAVEVRSRSSSEGMNQDRITGTMKRRHRSAGQKSSRNIN